MEKLPAIQPGRLVTRAGIFRGMQICMIRYDKPRVSAMYSFNLYTFEKVFSTWTAVSFAAANRLQQFKGIILLQKLRVVL